MYVERAGFAISFIPRDAQEPRENNLGGAFGMTSIPRLKSFSGPALFSYGFRPFFFLGAVYAAFAIVLWLPLWEGEITIPTLFAPRDWHVHEMLFGFVPAIVTGFLLTAIPNWTGRLPLQGAPLMALVALWVAGRLAVACSQQLGWLPAATIDSGFLVLIVIACAREIVAGENWRNLKVLVPVTVLMLTNAAFHWEVHTYGTADVSMRIGIATILTLIMLIGGRVIPSFTHNWLARFNPGRLPSPFGRFDAVAIVGSVAALAFWVVAPSGPATGTLLLVAGLLQFLRLARWAGERTIPERLVLILHIAYLFIPVGFVLSAMAAFGLALPSAGMHSWMTGAVGTMTLAIMTRASLGHTGQDLIATTGTQAIYVVVLVAALTRILAALFPAWAFILICVAGACWVAAFAGFAVLYGPLLLHPRTA
jgi:uncharacterized protein involved in response to NO